MVRDTNTTVPPQRQFLFFSFFQSHLFSSPSFFSSSLPFITQEIRGHIAGTPLPSPIRCVPSSFIAKRAQQFLPLSIRFELCVHTLGACKQILHKKKRPTRWVSNPRNRPIHEIVPIILVVKPLEDHRGATTTWAQPASSARHTRIPTPFQKPSV